MKKYIGSFAKPSNLMCHHEVEPKQLQMKIVVTECGKVYVKKEKHYTGVSNLRAAGGKWELRPANRFQTTEQFLRLVGAVEANYRGGPRLCV